MRFHLARFLVALLIAAIVSPGRVDATCGCDKKPPDLAVVRPRFAAGYWPIIIFHPSLVPGRQYDVTFLRTGNGRERRGKTVTVTAILAKDQGDFPFEELHTPPDQQTPLQPKPQLRVRVPPMGGPGPRAIRVVDRTTGRLAFEELPESQFMVIGEPIDMRPQATWRRSYLTAVDADGYLYIAFDFSKVLDPTIITGMAYGEPNRRLLPEHMITYNAQGYNFDTIARLPKDPMLFGWEIIPSDGANSDMMRYWRHSFRKWMQDHDAHAAGPKRLAPSDSYYWHADGTPHVDNNLLVIAVKEEFFTMRRQPKKGSPRRVIGLHFETVPGDNFVPGAAR